MIESALEPIPTDAEVALVAAIVSVDQPPQAVFDHAAAQGHEPGVDQTYAQHQAGESIQIAQMGSMEVEAISLHVAIHLFHPHPELVGSDGAPVGGAVSDQVPRFLFSGLPKGCRTMDTHPWSCLVVRRTQPK